MADKPASDGMLDYILYHSLLDYILYHAITEARKHMTQWELENITDITVSTCDVWAMKSLQVEIHLYVPVPGYAPQWCCPTRKYMVFVQCRDVHAGDYPSLADAVRAKLRSWYGLDKQQLSSGLPTSPG